MAGRDLTASFLVAVILIARRLNELRPVWAGAAAVAAVMVGLAVSTPTFRSDGRFGVGWRETARVHDPRLDDYQATALLLVNRPAPAPRDPEAARGAQAASAHQAAAVSPKPGMFGVAAGPSVFVIDPGGTVDPLMARLPPAVGSRRQGTNDRRVPDGYLTDVVADRSTLADPALASLDNELRLATRAPLGTPGRLSLITRLPGDTAKLVAQSSYGPERVTLEDVSGAAPRALREGGLVVGLPQRQSVSRIQAQLSANYDYEIEWRDGDDAISRTKMIGSLTAPDQLTPRTAASNVTTPVTSIWIRCGRGVGPCLVGTVRLVH